MKDKLLEDTSYIAAQQQSVTPDRLNQVKQDFEDTWKAIEEQVWYYEVEPSLKDTVFGK